VATKEIVACQASKLVVCKRANPSGRQVGSSIPKDISLNPGGKPQKQCAVEKKVDCKAHCTKLTKATQTQIFTSGGTCVLSVLECKAKYKTTQELERCLQAAKCAETVDLATRKDIEKHCEAGCKNAPLASCEVVALPY
jgi:hypothetical protein